MKKLLLTLVAAGLLMSPQQVQAKVAHLLPRPQQVTVQSGSFALSGTVSITDPTDCKALRDFFESAGCTIGTGGKTVTVELVESIEGAYDYVLAGFENEAYTLEVTPTAINITAVTPTGVIRAAQTLTQMAEGYEGTPALEAVSMKDWPAFKLRGYTHDVGRSFIDVPELKKHIELLSRFKVNCFHWHLTENQAWRMEIKAYPQLTSDASMTRFAGQYYTQEQCREVAAYAAEHGVVLIPEIDMPGHSAAFERAMGHSMQTDQGVAELKKILDEVAEVFADAPYIHIGADEQTITYTDFLKIMTDYVHGKGKKVVVWNPIRGVNVAGVDCDMTQMWSTSGNKIAGRPNIDCRYNYVNHFDVFADVVGIYKSNIYYADKGNAEIAGSISAYWNDRKTPTQEDIVKQNNMYAAMLATAERCWIGGGKAYIEVGGTTLPNSGDEYDEFADWESRFLFHKANSLKDEPIPYVKQTNVRWRITEPVPNGGNASAVFEPETYGKTASTELIPESFTYEGNTYGSSMATGAGIYLRHTWGSTVPTYFGKTNYSNVTSYAWTYVYSPVEQIVGAQIEFQNYGRSENDKAPDAGKWDRKGSDIWLNGERIAPPTWDNSGKGIGAEVDLLNENFSARKPVQVTLKQGWNKVFLKLPYVGAGGIRLNKWMFTCVFTDTEGKNAVEGLIYSPNQSQDAYADQLAAYISDLKRDMTKYIGTSYGTWPESAAAGLKAKIAEVEATINTAMTEAEREQQLADLKEAFDAFTSPEQMNKPAAGKHYRMRTPLRDNRYPTSKGAGNDIIGEQNPTTDASVWQFVHRGDGTFDIQNVGDNTYISPNSENNTALKTTADCPEKGWSLKPADTEGYVIITCGSAQFNQTNNAGHGFKVFNWGGGTNTSDGGCQYAIEEVTEPESQFEVFVTPTTDDVPYRIPAIAKAKNGNIIAVADYRYCRQDIGREGTNGQDGKIDLRYRISKDNGTTWGDIQTLVSAKGFAYANANNDAFHAAFGDPCIVADRESDRVMVLSCSGMVSFPNGTRNNHQGIARFYSEDNGETWSEPTDISERIYAQFDNRDKGPVQSMFVGSGKISQSNVVKVGDYYRIYCAVLAKQNSGPWVNYVLYSDDFGENWSVLGGVDESPIPSGGDEPKADELPDGSIVISSRAGAGRNFNIYTFTDAKSGKGYWGDMAESRQNNGGTIGVSCNGEIMFVPVVRKSDNKKMYLALQSVPVGPGRTNVSIYYKGLESPAAYATTAIFAANWEGCHRASNIGSAYSTMCLQDDNHIGFLYEEETHCAVSGGGYTILYKNYSVEQITDEKYTFDTAADREAFAFSAEALDARWSDAQTMVGSNVGNIKEESLTAVEVAYNAYKEAPSKEKYDAFAVAFLDVMKNAEQIGIDAKVMYRLCNHGRENGTLYLVAKTDGLTAAVLNESAKNQLFTFVPAGEDGVYYVANEETKKFVGQTGANETKIPVVNATGNNNKYRIVSDVYGRSSLSCTNPGGPNPAIHLAGDKTRLVPWTATGDPASLWYIEPTTIPTDIESVPAQNAESVSAAVYDLSGRRVARPAAGVYIRNGKKYIKK